MPRPDRARAVALVALVVSASGCGLAGSATGIANGEPDTVLAGPQGAVGQFVVECRFDHFAPDDPIVHPGHTGAAHLHQFFGAVGVTAGSDVDSLMAGATTCNQHADTAAYWAPALLADGLDPIEPIRSVAYYRAGEGVDPSTVVPYPPGLMLVAGDSTASEPQSVAVVAWSCGTGAVRRAAPLDCTGAPSLRSIVTYPDCWNGVDLKSADWHDPARRHVVYSEAGQCPATHPVHLPQLQFAIDYSPVPASELDGLAFSSGAIESGHADFWNTWDQQKLGHEVVECINRDLVCNISS